MKDVKVYLRHISDAVQRVRTYTQRGKRAFFKDPKTQDAVLRNLEVIGEAAKNLPTAFRAAHPGIPWRRMAGMRDKMIHEYFGVDLEIVWGVVARDLPRLGRQIGKLLGILLPVFLLGPGMAMAGNVYTTEVHDPVTGASLGQASAVSVLVQFKPGAGDAERAAVHAALGTTEARNLGADGLYEVRLPPSLHPDAALRGYSANSLVRGVSPNRFYHPLRTPNDPLTSQQYGLGQINAYGAWDFEVGASSPVTVAVMDSGVRKTHEEFLAKYDAARSRTFCPAEPCDGTFSACAADPGADVYGHGTGVAGVATAAGDNALGVAGLSWDARLVSLKIFDDAGCSDDATITAALNYALTLTTTTGRRTVVNMSLGSCPDTANPSSCGACDGTPEGVAVVAAVNAAVAAGTVLVAAAGNQNALTNPYKRVTCPAKIPGVIAVGATDSGQNIAYFSAVGPEMASQGVVAPGVGIESTSNAGDNAYSGGLNGTSFASPHIAGLAALMLSYRPSWGPTEIKTVIRNSGELIGAVSSLGAGEYSAQGNAQGSGRVNANSAMILTVRGLLAFPEEDSTPVIFPNPFHPSTTRTATIQLPAAAKASFTGIKIFTIDGRFVRELKGQSWDGRNDAGNPVATGTYIVLVTTDGKPYRGKVAVIR